MNAITLVLATLLAQSRGSMIGDPELPQVTPPAPVASQPAVPTPAATMDISALAAKIGSEIGQQLASDRAAILDAIKQLADTRSQQVPPVAPQSTLDTAALAIQIGEEVSKRISADRQAFLESLRASTQQPPQPQTHQTGQSPGCTCVNCVCANRGSVPTATPLPARRMLPRFASLQETQEAGWSSGSDANGKSWKAPDQPSLDAFLVQRNAAIAKSAIANMRAPAVTQPAVTYSMPSYTYAAPMATMPSYAPSFGGSYGGSFGSPMISSGGMVGLGGGCSTGSCR